MQQGTVTLNQMPSTRKGLFLTRVINRIACEISFERLASRERANGGSIVLARSLCVSFSLTIITLVLWNWIDPDRTQIFSLDQLREDLLELAPWTAAAFGAIYAAFYTRFASQWSYLASLYNQIKQAELEFKTAKCSDNTRNFDVAETTLAEWKAGYIEDAYEMHLSGKANVKGIIGHWSKEPKIKEAFLKGTDNGPAIWDKLFG